MNQKSEPKQKNKPRAVVWHRRDLRLDDNAALADCLARGFSPIGVFVFDSGILDNLSPTDRRVPFIHDSVDELARNYARHGCPFLFLIGDPKIQIPAACLAENAQALFFNRDYEPSAQARDAAVQSALAKAEIPTHDSKDHVIFEKGEVRTLAGGSFAVFTPYKNAWLKRFQTTPPLIASSQEGMEKLAFPPIQPSVPPTLESLGFEANKPQAAACAPGETGGREAASNFADRIDRYHSERDAPGKDTTSRLGIHFRFGTVSVRRMAIWAASLATEGASTWLQEIIWRDFYSMILSTNPTIANGASHLPMYANLAWSNPPQHIEAWKQGRTGVPIVDAGMRQLSETGFMHNRVRMITASYFVKQLDCDWRIGEAHFAKLLMDFDLASNNGGWQWCASTGSDAQPYFRVFNPQLQSERFDSDGAYIKTWVPELGKLPAKAIHAPHLAAPEVLAAAGLRLGIDYPMPLVSHQVARGLAIAKYAKHRDSPSSQGLASP